MSVQPLKRLIMTSADCCMMKKDGIRFDDFQVEIGYDQGTLNFCGHIMFIIRYLDMN